MAALLPELVPLDSVQFSVQRKQTLEALKEGLPTVSLAEAITTTQLLLNASIVAVRHGHQTRRYLDVTKLKEGLNLHLSKAAAQPPPPPQLATEAPLNTPPSSAPLPTSASAESASLQVQVHPSASPAMQHHEPPSLLARVGQQEKLVQLMNRNTITGAGCSGNGEVDALRRNVISYLSTTLQTTKIELLNATANELNGQGQRARVPA